MTDISEAVKALRATFNKYSEFGEKDTLSKSELTRLLLTELTLPPNCKQEVETYVKEMDPDGDGYITFKEFVKYLIEVIGMIEEQ